MQWWKEVTVWPDGIDYNHEYLLDSSKSKMYAFKRNTGNDIKVFKSPISFSTRGRKFIVNHTQYPTNMHDGVPSPEVVGTIQGSKGNVYTITLDESGNKQCSCTGFKFRGTCKHLVNISVA